MREGDRTRPAAVTTTPGPCLASQFRFRCFPTRSYRGNPDPDSLGCQFNPAQVLVLARLDLEFDG